MAVGRSGMLRSGSGYAGVAPPPNRGSEHGRRNDEGCEGDGGPRRASDIAPRAGTSSQATRARRSRCCATPRINHNIEVMRRFCQDAGVAIAPHGKTTMAPQLFERQLAAGAWGITAANAQQAALMVRLGVQRIFIANEVVDPAALTWLNDMLQADPRLEISWYVDSEAGLALAEASAGRSRAAASPGRGARVRRRAHRCPRRRRRRWSWPDRSPLLAERRARRGRRVRGHHRRRS